MNSCLLLAKRRTKGLNKLETRENQSSYLVQSSHNLNLNLGWPDRCSAFPSIVYILGRQARFAAPVLVAQVYSCLCFVKSEVILLHLYFKVNGSDGIVFINLHMYSRVKNWSIETQIYISYSLSLHKCTCFQENRKQYANIRNGYKKYRCLTCCVDCRKTIDAGPSSPN
jgi:hypothetical protein